MTSFHREASARRPPLRFLPGLVAALALLLATACSHGRGEPELAGRALVAFAAVCEDANRNGACDPAEPSARTERDGSFALAAPVAPEGVLLVEAEAGVSVDVDTGEPFRDDFTLAAEARYRHLLTPFATLALDLPERLAPAPEAALREAFAIPARVPVLAEEPVAGRPPVTGFARIAATVYARAHAEARLGGAGPLEARQAAARKTLEAAPALADYFAATVGWEAAPPPNGSGATTLDQLMASAGKGMSLRDLPGGPGSFGAGYDEVGGRILPGAQCVDPVFDVLERTCRNQWTFRLDVLSSVDEVVRNVYGSLGAKADVVVATASGTLSMEEYKRRYRESAHVYVEATMNRCNYGLTGALKSEYEGLYAHDYDRFVSTCGNRYLSDITTGGRFVGTFDKDLSAVEDKEEYKLRLKAKVLGCTVFDKTWKKRTDDAFADLDMSVQIFSTDGRVSIQNGTMEALTARVVAFYDHVQADGCADADAYLRCAYTGSFADYATATALAKDPAADFERLRHNYYLWLAARSAYQAALERASDVVVHPDRYNLAGATDPFYDARVQEATGGAPGFEPDPPPALQDVQAWVAAATRSLGDLEAVIGACEENPSSCITAPEEEGFSSWMDLLRLLPTRKVFVHADCEELSYQYGYVADGGYTAYFGGDFLAPYPAECRGMDGAEPETYLVLPSTSPDPENLTANYSVRVDAAGARTARLVRALRLHPAPGAGGYRMQAFVPTREPYVTSTLADDLREPPLVAASCDGSTVRASLDLGGTPFRFAAAVAGQVVDQAGNPAPAALSADGRRLEITAVGAGGGCSSVSLHPPAGGVDLEYAP